MLQACSHLFPFQETLETIVVLVPLTFRRLRSFPPSTFSLSTTSRSYHIFFFNQSYPTTAMSSIHILISTPTNTCWPKIQQVLTLEKVLPLRFVGDQRTSANASRERLINRTFCLLAENPTLQTWDFLGRPIQGILHCVMQSNNTALNRTREWAECIQDNRNQTVIHERILMLRKHIWRVRWEEVYLAIAQGQLTQS